MNNHLRTFIHGKLKSFANFWPRDRFYHKDFSDWSNYPIKDCTFPEQLRCTDVTPVFKKKSRTEKGNIFKIYEKCFYKPHYNYFDVIFSQNQCGFRKDFSAINCRLPMIGKWRKPYGRVEVYGVLVTDHSKTFICLPLELIIAQLYV